MGECRLIALVELTVGAHLIEWAHLRSMGSLPIPLSWPKSMWAMSVDGIEWAYRSVHEYRQIASVWPAVSVPILLSGPTRLSRMWFDIIE